jgi:prepilin-type processing-associated H-X9-DG protein
MDYDDCFPPQSGAAGLELLRCNDYLSDYKMFTCPSSAVTPCSSPGGLADANISYVYRGGLTETDPADSAICWDKPNNHKNYGNILFIDGSVKGFSGVNWMDNIK